MVGSGGSLPDDILLPCTFSDADVTELSILKWEVDIIINNLKANNPKDNFIKYHNGIFLTFPFKRFA